MACICSLDICYVTYVSEVGECKWPIERIPTKIKKTLFYTIFVIILLTIILIYIYIYKIHVGVISTYRNNKETPGIKKGYISQGAMILRIVFTEWVKIMLHLTTTDKNAAAIIYIWFYRHS